ncbi:MAG TPA: cytochrome c peroxidase [Polyangiaceae bacterium]
MKRVAILAGCIALAACGSAGKAPAADAPSEPEPSFTKAELAALSTLSPVELPPPPADASNRWADDSAAASFGKVLFFDPRLSGELLDGDNDGSANALGRKGETGKVSCAGCHLPPDFSDTRTIRRQISLGAGWGKRRAPSVLDVGHSKLVMWDGRRDALYNQVFGVIESPVEMNSSRLYAAKQIFEHHRAAYEALFGPMPPLDDTARFPALLANETGCRKLDASNNCMQPLRGAPGDGAEFDGMRAEDQEAVTRVVVNAGKALGAYQRLLTCGPSRFDEWMHRDDKALSVSEMRGAALFVGKAGCITCHSGPFLSDEKFHNVGLKAAIVATAFLNANDPGASVGIEGLRTDPLNVQGPYSDGDDGRIPEPTAELLGSFRTPKLRCVAMRPSFMHTGQFTTLDDVVSFFNRGGDIGGFQGTKEIHALGLDARERGDLVAFLRALDGPGPSSSLFSPTPAEP